MVAVPDFEFDIRTFPEGTKTAHDAAAAIGTEVAAIVKSLVFVVQSETGEEPVLALVPGDLRLDTAALAAAAGGQNSERASLDAVKVVTGFAAGGTPPFGHTRQLRVFADPRLRRSEPVWAAGGTPNSVFPISISDLDRLAAPIWAEIAV